MLAREPTLVPSLADISFRAFAVLSANRSPPGSPTVCW
jgi:hypothetical protein